MRYAKALLEYTERAKVSEEVYKQMQILFRNFSLEPRLRTILINPVLREEDRGKLLESAAGGKVGAQLRKFLQLVMRNRREELLQSIALSFMTVYRKAHNISIARMETAVPLPQETQDRIINYIGARTGGEVELDLKVNPEIIGGFIFSMDFREMDASVVRQLKDLKKEFTTENRRLV